MSLTFEDFERDYPVAQEKPKQEPRSTPVKPNAPAGAVKPSFGEAMGQVWDKTRPVIEAGAQRAINPFHYTGDQEDYTNIDWAKTAAHGGAEAVIGKRLWDFATGKSAERETERMNAETNRMNAQINQQNAQAKSAPQRTITPVPQPKPQANVVAAPGPAAPATQPSPSQTFEQNRLEKQRNAQASIEGRMIVPKAEPAPVQPTFTPENVPTSEQATQELVKEGKIKKGKAGGSISPQDASLLSNEAAGKTKAAVTETVGTPPPEGWRSQYTKGKKNPIGPGGFNYIAGQYGPEEAAARWEQQYGKKNVPYEQVVKDFSAAKRPELPVAEGNKPGGSFPRPEFIPEYIRGSAPVAAMANLAGNALGALGLTQAYKHGEKTGDWSDFGLGMANQIVGNVAPRAAIPLALMSPNSVSSGTLESPEARELFAKIHAKKVGGGRGIAPPSDYKR